MKVALFGATGFSGQAVLNELLAQGHEVTILVRNPAKVTIQHKHLQIVQGDVLNPQTLAKVLKGQAAAINCLGIGGKGNGKPNDFISRATAQIVAAMDALEVPRFICMSNVGAGDSIAAQPWFFRTLILPYFMKWLYVIIQDKNKMEPIVMQSNLDWILVRCPNIVDKAPKGKVQAILNHKGVKLSITNQDLAVFMVQQLHQDQYLKQAPCVCN